MSLRSRSVVTLFAALAAFAGDSGDVGLARAADIGNWHVSKIYAFKLDDPASSSATLPLLDAFHDASIDTGAGPRRYLRGLRARTPPWWTLTLTSESSVPTGAWEPSARRLTDVLPVVRDDTGFGFAPTEEPELGLSPSTTPAWLDPSFKTPFVKTPGAVFAFNGFDALWSLPPSKPIPNWRCRRRPVRMARYAGESDAFLIVRCDGTVALEAFDRLTLMARETSAPRPGDLLPDEPDAAAMARGEWSPGVRLVHPRLLWVIQRIADAFPWRTIYVFSGYRHDPSGVKPKPGSHHSMHSEGRALDIYVMGIPNAALYQVCHKLDDVGCGYYPNSKFVHVDVRRPASGHPFWIDVSQPGEPSHYVDAWPGVIESGGLVWDGRGADPTRR